MSAPMVQGSRAAAVMRFVQRSLGTIGYRKPVREMAHPAHAHHAALLCVRRLSLCVSQLATISLCLTALENYYRAMGASWDAERMSDMRWPVDEALHDHELEAERERSNRHGEMWQRAFAQTFAKWPRHHPPAR